MKDGCPYGHPNHHLRVQIDVVEFHDVVDRLIKKRYKTGDADDGDRLSPNSTENYARKSRR